MRLRKKQARKSFSGRHEMRTKRAIFVRTKGNCVTVFSVIIGERNRAETIAILPGDCRTITNAAIIPVCCLRQGAEQTYDVRCFRRPIMN